MAAVIDLTMSPSPPMAIAAAQHASSSSTLAKRDHNAQTPSSSKTPRKVTIFVYASDSDCEQEQVPSLSQGSSSSDGFLEVGSSVRDEEDESVLEFRSHLARFAGNADIKASSSSSRRPAPSRARASKSPTKGHAASSVPVKPGGALHASIEAKSDEPRPAAKKRVKRPSKAEEDDVSAPVKAASSSAASPTKSIKRHRKSASPEKPITKPPVPRPPLPPPPLDLTPFPNSKLLLLMMCPFCSHSFPSRQAPPTRRRHLCLCGASKLLSVSVALAILDEEIRRLDRLTQLQEQEKQATESAWDLLVRTSGLAVRRTQDEEMCDALGLPKGSARRREVAMREEEVDLQKCGDAGGGEASKNARRWKKLDTEGTRVCLLERHADGGRRTARCNLVALYGDDGYEADDGDEVYDLGYSEPIAAFVHKRKQQRLLEESAQPPPFTQSMQHRPSRLAARKGPGAMAGYGLGLHLASRSKGKSVA